MISRRSLLATGAVVGIGAAGIAGAAAFGRLDDLADAIGVTPRPRPDEDDVELLHTTAADVAELDARVRATADAHQSVSDALAPIQAICDEHVSAVSGNTADLPVVPEVPADAVTELAGYFASSAKQRSADVIAAASPEVAMLLASMSASQRQCARVIRVLVS